MTDNTRRPGEKKLLSTKALNDNLHKNLFELLGQERVKEGKN
jgi:hypothetical protein